MGPLAHSQRRALGFAANSFPDQGERLVTDPLPPLGFPSRAFDMPVAERAFVDEARAAQICRDEVCGVESALGPLPLHRNGPRAPCSQDVTVAQNRRSQWRQPGSVSDCGHVRLGTGRTPEDCGNRVVLHEAADV